MQTVRANNTSNSGNHKAQLLRKLREYDFAIIETALFLDTHPYNKKALMYYTKLREEREILAREYEEKVAPITIYGNKNKNAWNWIDSPWPWEGDC